MSILAVRGAETLFSPACCSPPRRWPRPSRRLPIHVAARGTGETDKRHILRGDKLLYSQSPGSAEASCEYVDESARGEQGTFYCYVRLERKDGQAAWASSFWVTD